MSLLDLNRKIDYNQAMISIKNWKLVNKNTDYLFFIPEDEESGVLLRVPISEADKVLTYRVINPVGDAIRKIREEAGISQRKLSSISGVSQMAISNVENGNCEKINSDILDAVLNALNIPLDEVYPAELSRT